MNDKEFRDETELRKFLEHAKVANPPYNPAGAILFLMEKIRLLENRITDLNAEVDELNGLSD